MIFSLWNPLKTWNQILMNNFSRWVGSTTTIKNLNLGKLRCKVGPLAVLNGVITPVSRFFFHPSYPFIRPFVRVITPFITIVGGPPCGFSLLFVGLNSQHPVEPSEVPYNYICNDDFNFLGRLVKRGPWLYR